MQAVQALIRETGGPEVIGFETVELGEPGEGEVLMKNEAVGVNFIDTYHRTGLYKLDLPTGLGMEAAGTVEKVGAGVTNVAAGDRVAVFMSGVGAYSSARIIKADRLVKLPDAVSFEDAASLMLKGATAEFLIERCAKVKTGDVVLVHAGGGATGQILIRWLKHIGATVVSSASTEEKRQLARDAGADVVTDYDEEAVLSAVREASGGKGADVVFDGVGAKTWELTLKAARRFGLVVSFGNASGPVTGVAMTDLTAHGSLFVTRPTMMHYYEDKDDFQAGSKRLVEMIADGVVVSNIGQRIPLKEAAEAHRKLEARETHGATILLP